MRYTAWMGTITSVIGSFAVAFGLTTIGYPMFTIGSIAWLLVAWEREDMALASLNMVFLTANIIGMVRYL